MVQKTVLDNGVRLVSQRLPGSFSTTLGVWVQVGSRDETPAQGGVSHFIEHMAFKGTEQRNALDIARQIDRLGGMANAFTSREHTCFYARALPEHLADLSDLLLDLFLNPAYLAEELERERQVILQEISSQEDSPEELVHVLCGSHFWPDHPLGRPILGTAETVSAMTREDILGYLKRSYRPHRLVVAAAGQVEHQRLVDLMAPQLAALAPDPAANGRTAPRANTGWRVVPRDSEQVHVAMAMPGTSAVDQDRFAAALLNTVLGGNMSSRLFQEVREKRGLAYSVYSYLSSHYDTGQFGVYLGVAPERTAEAIKVVRHELQRLVTQPLSDQELSEAQDHLKGSILLSAESPDARMTRLARNEFYFERAVPLEEVTVRIEQVSVQDISRLAAAKLDADRLAGVVLGPVDPEALLPELQR